VAAVRQLRAARCAYPLSILVPLGADPHAAADAAKADIIHLCWERGGQRPQDLVTRDLLDRARHAGREIVLWHEERPAVLADLVEQWCWGSARMNWS
jgi:glycerophosphoryl diester phosphodiesterase